MVLVLATGLIVWGVGQPGPPRLVRLAVSPDEAGLVTPTITVPAVAISPGGEHIAYLAGGEPNVGADQLRARALNSATSTTLVTDGLILNPFFSPNGQSVGFFDRSTAPLTLKRVPVQGGPISTICDLLTGLRGASWGADGTIIFGTLGTQGLWRVTASGGEPAPLTRIDPTRREGSHQWPHILPGGNTVLFTVVGSSVEDAQIVALSLDTLEQTVVLRGASFPRYSQTGHLLFSRAGDVWAVAFDLTSLETVGTPVAVQEGVSTKTSGAADVAISDNGTLVFIPRGTGFANQRRLLWVGRDGIEEPTAAPAQDYSYVQLSPDGGRAVVEIRGDEGIDVWVAELGRGTLQRITSESGDDTNPLWSPAGRRLVLYSTRNGRPELLWKSADGTGDVEVLASFDADVGEIRPSGWSPDGATLLVAPQNLGTGPDIGTLTPGGTANWEPLIQTPGIEGSAVVSPNGRWVAYQSTETGRYEVYVDRFPGLGDRQPVSINGGACLLGRAKATN